VNKVDSLKLKYNSTLQRIRKGEVFLDDSNIPLPERELHIPSFIKLTRQAGVVLRELRQLGVIYTVEEFENGFGGMKIEQGNYNQG
jgi:hypothetical protein